MARNRPSTDPASADIAQPRTATVHDAVISPHADLIAMFAQARGATSTAEDPRAPFARCDTFLATLSRHLAAVEDVIFPEVRRRMPEGPRHVARHIRLSRGMELTMRALEGSFYGDAYYPADVRAMLWRRMERLLDLHNEAEQPLINTLGSYMSAPEQRAVAARFHDAFAAAPTRPHPFSPHSRWLSSAQHRLWAIADRAMDSMDNRIIPRARASKRAKPDSLLSQYLTGSPSFREDGPPGR